MPKLHFVTSLTPPPIYIFFLFYLFPALVSVCVHRVLLALSSTLNIFELVFQRPRFKGLLRGTYTEKGGGGIGIFPPPPPHRFFTLQLYRLREAEKGRPLRKKKHFFELKKNVPTAIKLEGGGGKALMARSLKNIFLWLPLKTANVLRRFFTPIPL